MKQCEWCEKTMLPSNFRKHQERCFFRNVIELKKSELQRMKENYNPPKEFSEASELSLTELKQYLTDNFNKTCFLYKKLVVNDLRDPIERLREMHVSQPTKENYVREWVLFNKWLKKNKKAADKESADTYLASLKCRASTLKKKQYMLQNILQYLFDSSVRLNKINMRISYIPKYALTDEEIERYLTEQEEVDTQDFLMQKLMLRYGLRVNTVASLRIKHLEFLLPGGEKMIFLPDSKVKRQREEKISQDLIDPIAEFLDADSNFSLNEEAFVFYPKIFKHNERKRANEFCKIINERIRNSKVLKKNKNFKYSSHMFRKTKAFNLFQKGVEELKANARIAIGQSQNSTAIDSYIYNTI